MARNDLGLGDRAIEGVRRTSVNPNRRPVQAQAPDGSYVQVASVRSRPRWIWGGLTASTVVGALGAGQMGLLGEFAKDGAGDIGKGLATAVSIPLVGGYNFISGLFEGSGIDVDLTRDGTDETVLTIPPATTPNAPSPTIITEVPATIITPGTVEVVVPAAAAVGVTQLQLGAVTLNCSGISQVPVLAGEGGAQWAGRAGGVTGLSWETRNLLFEANLTRIPENAGHDAALDPNESLYGFSGCVEG